MTPKLYVLAAQAWELRGSPYLIDAVQAIEDWYWRRPLIRYAGYLAQRAERNAQLIRLLRDTDPDRIVIHAEAA